VFAHGRREHIDGTLQNMDISRLIETSAVIRGRATVEANVSMQRRHVVHDFEPALADQGEVRNSLDGDGKVKFQIRPGSSIIIEDCKDLAPDVFGHALQHGICRHMRWGRVVRAGDDVSAEELLVAFAALRKNVGYVDGV